MIAPAKAARIAFLGDVMLGRLVSEELAWKEPRSLWGDTLPVLNGVDAVFANLECAVTSHKETWERTPKVFHFGAIPKAIDVLTSGNVRCVSLANNHILDFEVAGLIDTLDRLDHAGIAHSGAGQNRAAAKEAAWVTLENGLKIAFLGLTDNERPFAAGGDEPGVYWCSDSPDDPQAPTDETFAALRAEGADLIILSAHMGPNMVIRPSPALRRFGQRMLEAGADLFHGHSAHIFQGVEPLKGGLILHDCGDFLDDYAVDPDLHNDWSFIFIVDIDGDGCRRLELLPVELSLAEVNLAKGRMKEAICARMLERNRDFGAALEETEQGLILELRGQ